MDLFYFLFFIEIKKVWRAHVFSLLSLNMIAFQLFFGGLWGCWKSLINNEHPEVQGTHLVGQG